MVSSREAYVTGFAVDRLDINGTILILCRSIHGDEGKRGILTYG